MVNRLEISRYYATGRFHQMFLLSILTSRAHMSRWINRLTNCFNIVLQDLFHNNSTESVFQFQICQQQQVFVIFILFHVIRGEYSASPQLQRWMSEEFFDWVQLRSVPYPPSAAFVISQNNFRNSIGQWSHQLWWVSKSAYHLRRDFVGVDFDYIPLYCICSLI